MAVLIEAITLVIPVAKLEDRFPGGLEGFRRLVPEAKFCCDGELAAMHHLPRKIQHGVKTQLRRAGLEMASEGRYKDMATVFQVTGSMAGSCDWLVVNRNSDGVVFASLVGDDGQGSKIHVPVGWKLDGSLSQTLPQVPLDQFNERFDFLRSDGNVDIYVDLQTGTEIRAARTRMPPISAVTKKILHKLRLSHLPLLERAKRRSRYVADDRATKGALDSGAQPPKKGNRMLDNDGEEIIKVKMGFADYHELDEKAEEGDYEDEDVYAVQVGPNRYRLAENPMWTEMAAFHDVVEGEVDEDGVFFAKRVVEKSGLKTIRTGVPRMFYFSDFGKAFLDSVKEAGGMWDILFWGIFTYNVPEDRVEEFEEAFRVACREASLLGKDETRMPGDLYRETPKGGSVRREEEN